jgi:metal-responsive CopG/Arc/MetJ family transcriptional regulator
MRTIVDIPSDTLTRLDAWAEREKVSRAEIVRRVLATAVTEQDKVDLSQFAGIWKDRDIDGLAWQQNLRAEWDD